MRNKINIVTIFSICFFIIPFQSISNKGINNVLISYNKMKYHDIRMAQGMGYNVDKELLGKIYDYSVRYNRDFNRMLRWVWTESQFYSNATSYVGAMGLLQIMPSTAKFVKNKILKNPAYFGLTKEEIKKVRKADYNNIYEEDLNLLFCFSYIHMLSNNFGCMKIVLARYYSGRSWKHYIDSDYVNNIY